MDDCETEAEPEVDYGNDKRCDDVLLLLLLLLKTAVERICNGASSFRFAIGGDRAIATGGRGGGIGRLCVDIAAIEQKKYSI